MSLYVKSISIFKCVCICMKNSYVVSITLRPDLIQNGFGFAGIAVNNT